MNNVDDPRIMPGCRVLGYDYRLFKNDIDTPARTLMLPATVVSRYGEMAGKSYDGEPPLGPYPDIVDLQFDHMDRVSKGHFTSGVEVIE